MPARVGRAVPWRSRERVAIPDGFEWVEDPGAPMVVRADDRGWLVPLLRAARGGWGSAFAVRPLPGGRGGSVIVRSAEGHELVLRAYRRGGVPARLLRDTYFGVVPRPFRELHVTEVLRRRGAPVVEVLAAAARWVLPGIYRGWIGTRYIAGARTFWEWAVTRDDAGARDRVLLQIGGVIRRLHACGARHPDLNLNNILVCPAAAAEPVLLIDFDRASLRTPSRRTANADLERLRRSARKLDPQGARVTAGDLERVLDGYHQPDR